MSFGWNPEDPPATFCDTELPSYRLDYFSELTAYDMFESNQASWNLEELGYAYDAPHFHLDGRIEGGLHPPEYYAYSPHPGSWQDGLQEIDEFDWPSEQYDHPLLKTQNNPEQGMGEALALEGVVSTQATTTGESSVATDQVSDQVSDQAKPHQPEVNLGDQVENWNWLSPSIENTAAPDTSTPAASSPPSTSPPSVSDSIPGQVSKSSVLSSPTSSDAQAGVVDSKQQDEKISDGADELQTSLVGKYGDAEEQGVEENSEWRDLQDENSSNSEATSENDRTPSGDNTTSVEIPESSTSPAAKTSDALPSPDTKSEQPVQEPSEVHCINSNSMSPEASDPTHIADVVSISGGLEEVSLLQTEDNPKEEEKLPGQAEPVQDLGRLNSISLPPQGTAREIPRESDLGTGPSNAAALPAADLPKSPIGKTPNSASPENLAHVEDEVGAQWQTELQDAVDKVPNCIFGLASPGQQCVRSMILPPLPFPREEDVNDEQGSETSALSDAPSFDTNATLGFTPDGLARNPTEGASSDGSVVTPMNAATPTKTLRLRLKVDSMGSRKRSKPAKKASSASDTDSDVPPKKKQRQGTYAKPFLQPPRNLSDQIIFGPEAEVHQPDNDDGDTEEHYSDVETPTTPPGQAFDPIPSMKTRRSRPKVSNRELEGLIPTKYRERPPKARNQSQSIARQLFTSQKKPDALGMFLTSTKALEESPTVWKNDDTLILVEGAGTAGSTSQVSTRSKKKAPAASVVTLSGTPGSNKYGFTPRRGPKAPGKVGLGLFASKPAVAAKTAAAAASSKTMVGAARRKGGVAGRVPTCKTRRGSKREGEGEGEGKTGRADVEAGGE